MELFFFHVSFLLVSFVYLSFNGYHPLVSSVGFPKYLLEGQSGGNNFTSLYPFISSYLLFPFGIRNKVTDDNLASKGR